MCIITFWSASDPASEGIFPPWVIAMAQVYKFSKKIEEIVQAHKEKKNKGCRGKVESIGNARHTSFCLK